MTRAYYVESGSDETIPVDVDAPADPTGGAVTFSFVATNAGDSDTFTAGSWVASSWDSTALTAKALTPTLPSSGSTVTLTAGRWKMYVKTIVGSETAITSPGVLVVA